MKIIGDCEKHGVVHGVVMASDHLSKAWKEGNPWDDENFVVIYHMAFFLEPVPFWLMKDEVENLGLKPEITLDDESTEKFLDWADHNLSSIPNCCFKEWRGRE